MNNEKMDKAFSHIWICEFCYRVYMGNPLPDEWDRVWQSNVCPVCQKRVELDGGYGVVKDGAYAVSPDPRGEEPVEYIPVVIAVNVAENLSEIERLLKIAGDKCMPSLLEAVPELGQAKELAHSTWKEIIESATT